MKTNTTLDRVQVRTLPTGRRDLVARQVLLVVAALRAEVQAQAEAQAGAGVGAGAGDAEGAGAAVLVEVEGACAALIADSPVCSDLERRYAVAQAKPQSSAQGATPHARSPVDVQADRFVAGLESAATTFVRGLDASEAEHQAAARFIAQAFPKGVSYITQAAYPEQLQRMRDLVAYCRKDGAAAVATLQLEVWVRKIDELIPDYEAMLKAQPPQTVRYAEVQSAQRKGHLLLRHLVLAILNARVGGSEEEAEAARGRLLAPLTQQEEAVADRLRRHLAVRDVDPITGEESPTPLPTEPPA
jgi:hypothetical protein